MLATDAMLGWQLHSHAPHTVCADCGAEATRKRSSLNRIQCNVLILVSILVTVDCGVVSFSR